jgi:hypothetical protein
MSKSEDTSSTEEFVTVTITKNYQHFMYEIMATVAVFRAREHSSAIKRGLAARKKKLKQQK